MSRILFFDPECRQPYDTETLHRQPVGGAESSLVRIADGLNAFVMQHNRTTRSARYLPADPLAGIEHVIVNRSPQALELVHAMFPTARLYLWLHDALPWGSKRARRLADAAKLIERWSVTLICVSSWQRRDVERILDACRIAADIRTIHNVIADHIEPGAEFDPSKLVFFSSPTKGLHFAVDAFRAIRRHIPSMILQVANPGYRLGKSAQVDGVEWLGALPQERVHQEVRSALCAFLPNFVIPETFGLVFAESNALGTPVLTHDCGAASEVLADHAQILPVTRAARAYEATVRKLSIRSRAVPARAAESLGVFDSYIERIRDWREGNRPTVQRDPRFQLAKVLEDWRTLLAGTPSTTEETADAIH